jgi:hypothetical protein
MKNLKLNCKITGQGDYERTLSMLHEAMNVVLKARSAKDIRQLSDGASCSCSVWLGEKNVRSKGHYSLEIRKAFNVYSNGEVRHESRAYWVLSEGKRPHDVARVIQLEKANIEKFLAEEQRAIIEDRESFGSDYRLQKTIEELFDYEMTAAELTEKIRRVHDYLQLNANYLIGIYREIISKNIINKDDKEEAAKLLDYLLTARNKE